MHLRTDSLPVAGTDNGYGAKPLRGTSQAARYTKQFSSGSNHAQNYGQNRKSEYGSNEDPYSPSKPSYAQSKPDNPSYDDDISDFDKGDSFVKPLDATRSESFGYGTDKSGYNSRRPKYERNGPKESLGYERNPSQYDGQESPSGFGPSSETHPASDKRTSGYSGSDRRRPGGYGQEPASPESGGLFDDPFFKEDPDFSKNDPYKIPDTYKPPEPTPGYNRPGTSPDTKGPFRAQPITRPGSRGPYSSNTGPDSRIAYGPPPTSRPASRESYGPSSLSPNSPFGPPDFKSDPREAYGRPGTTSPYTPATSSSNPYAKHGYSDGSYERFQPRY